MNIKDVLKKRLETLIEKEKDKDPSLSTKKQAELIGIPYPTFMKYVNGDVVCSIDKLALIADYYNVSTDYLLGRTKNPTVEEDVKQACETTGLSGEAIEVLHHIKNIADGTAFSKETQNDINETKQLKLWPADLKQEYINYNSEQERKLGETFIDTINAIFTASNFEKFIKELTIYINTDFLKKTPQEEETNKSKKIWSVVTDDKNEYDQRFIFGTDLIEQGIFASLQQFLQSLKNKDPKYRLVDIDTISEKEE